MSCPPISESTSQKTRDSQLGRQIPTFSLSPEWGLWKQGAVLPYCFLVDRRIPNNVYQEISEHQAEWITVPLTTCVKFSKEKSGSFHSPTEGMTATSVNTVSIHVCLFKKALSSATDPKDTLVGLSSAERLSFIYQRDCIHSWKSQESKVNVFTFKQLSPKGRVKCKQEKQGELPLKGQISAR